MAYDHVQTMKNLEAIARNAALSQMLVSDQQLDQAWETLERCDSLGAVLLPTEYRNALQSGTLDRQRELVAFVRALRKGLRDLFPNDATLDAILKRPPTPAPSAAEARTDEEAWR